MQAKQLLGKAKAKVSERRIFQEKPTVDEVRAVAALLPNGPRDILSTRSQRFKELELAGKEFTDEELINLLAEEPGLWRRPVIVRGDKAFVGFNQKGLTELLS